MKKLILLSVLLTSSAFAIQEIVDRNDSNQIATTVKDLEVKQLLEQTSEFNKCREAYPFAATDGQTERSKKIRDAQDCFKKKIGDNKGQNLAELSDKLDLQSYDLVKGKNTKDIQKYLDDKMYESMTGVKPGLQGAELANAMKFKNKKQIDQKVFITLWKTQLVKNSLFTISNFCLTKIRRESNSIKMVAAANVSGAAFGDYWAGWTQIEFADQNGTPQINAITDTGSPSFGNFSNADDKDKIYEDILKSMNINDQSGFKIGDLSNFFFTCGKLIVPLCEDFKKNSGKVDVNTPVSAVDSGTPTKGSAACLVKARLEEYKKALADTDKYEQAFAEMQADGKIDQLMAIAQKGEPPKIFGKGSGDESLDNLTNYTSADFIENSKKDDKAEKCNQNPQDPDCEKYFTGNEEDFLKAQQSIETEMTLKREVEMARVKEMKEKNDAKLEEYLEQNGFYDILKNLKENKYPDADALAKAVGAEFEAKKVAVLEDLNNKLGSRQIKKTDGATEKTAAVTNSVNATKEERARLAQVVLFNNIITSNLRIERDLGNGKRVEAGRNVNAFNKEAQALSKANVNVSLFQNLKAQGDGSASQVGQNDQLGGITLIEEMLGKEKKP